MSVFKVFSISSFVLGINKRNLKYISSSSSKPGRRVADSKLLSKRILAPAGIPVSPTLAVFRTLRDIQSFDWATLPNSFVLKPNKSLAGKGIMVIFGRKKGEDAVWVRADRQKVSSDFLKAHILDILEGGFSTGRSPDQAFIEERVRIHPDLKPYSFRGIPDIRIIVYNKVPIMAMLRLPTKESKGRANLDMGGIGVGIDLATGLTTYAIKGKGRPISYLPYKRLILTGFKVPLWEKILALAVRCQAVAKINFLGVDVALDREKGPLVLELNSRPGLSIQLANLAPLEERLRRVAGLEVESLEKGIAIAQSLFGKKPSPVIKEVSGKKILSIYEPVTILDKEGRQVAELVAKIDTGAYSSSIDAALAKKLGINRDFMMEKSVRSALGGQARKYINFNIILKGEKIQTRASLSNRLDLRHRVIIGRRDLKRFLIDPSKTKVKNI